jgi:peptide/bleomycin uptake transporter
MFKSFFPNPRLFFPLALDLDHLFDRYLVSYLKMIWDPLLNLTTTQQPPVIGLGHFVTDSFLLLYLYYTVSVLVFAGLWMIFSPHPWQLWSILGSAGILFSTYFSVQVSVAINNWRRPFFDTVQNALSAEASVPASEMYDLI